MAPGRITKLAAVILLFCASLAGAQILPGILNVQPAAAVSHHFSQVQTGNCIKAAGTGTTLTCSLGSGFTAGDIIFILNTEAVGIAVSASSVGSLTLYPSTACTVSGQMGVITGLSGGTTSFSLTIGSIYNAQTVAIIEYSGVNTTTPVGQQSGCTYAYAVPAATGSVTTTATASEVCGYVTSTGTSATFTAGAGYSNVTPSGSGSPSYYPMWECSTAVQAAGTYNPAFTQSGGSAFDYATIAFNLQ
jgi:hypothetical protein